MDMTGVVDEELMLYFRKLNGYWMTFKNTDKALYFCIGPNDCGKSDMMDRMRCILKDRINVCSADVFIDNGSSSNHKTYLTRLIGVSMVYVQELPTNRPIRDDVAKAISGSDVIAFRGCGEAKEQNLESGCKAVICSNGMPKIIGADPGIAMRVRKIPFRRNHVLHGTTEERAENTKMFKRLETQDCIDAMFAWWLEGAKEYYQQEGEGVPRIVQPEVVKLENIEFLEDSNSWDHFLKEKAEVWSASSTAPIGTYTWERSNIQETYSKFCKEKAYTGNQVLDKSQVPEKIKGMFPCQKGRGAYIGLRPKPETD